MKIFIDNLTVGSIKVNLNPIQRIIKDEGYSLSFPQNVRLMYELANSPENSDYCALPFMWNDYVDNGKLGLAKEIKDKAEKAGKKLIIFSSGDSTANIPFKDSIIIQSSCYQSRDGINGIQILSIPSFIEDYIQLYCNGVENYRQKKQIPVVGFCGQGRGSLFDYVRRHMIISIKKLAFRTHITKWEPPVIEPTLFRKRVLQRVRANSGIESNFLVRSKYRAGYRIKKKDPFHISRLEFVKNILESDYTVCMRGGGNFSVRFYETLALGRIPIFINSDCVLPFDKIMNYKDYMIWVEQDELSYLPEKIIDFHRSLSDSQFTELQKACRSLWKEYFTKNGFFKHLPEALKV